MRRDRERNMFRKGAGKTGKGGRSKPFMAGEYQRALSLGAAAATVRSHTSRLKTWDRALEYLANQGLLTLAKDPKLLTPEIAKAGVAYLKARGYRSAELYLSSAVTRHKSTYAMEAPLLAAQQEAVRISRRGIGPARGKQPIPMPRPQSPHFEALATGIWFLLRISELIALNVEDVRQRRGPRLQMGVWVRRSKTDQEAAGALVCRDCVCEEPGAAPWCPAHLLWRVVCSRKDMMCETGTVSGKAPLFTDVQGGRLTSGTIAEAVRATASEAGLDTKAEGAWLHGTHSLRVTGAILGFAANLTEEEVRSLGRWSSTKAMRNYLRGTPVVKASAASLPMARAMTQGIMKDLTGIQFQVALDQTPEPRRGPEKPRNPEGMMGVRHNLTGREHARFGSMLDHMVWVALGHNRMCRSLHSEGWHTVWQVLRRRRVMVAEEDSKGQDASDPPYPIDIGCVT